MSENEPNNSSKEAEQKQVVTMTPAEFLRKMPPSDEYTRVSNALHQEKYGGAWQIVTPAISLNCHVCDGERIYRYTKGSRYIESNEDPTLTYVTYVCSNCKKATKMFSLAVKTGDTTAPEAKLAKFGEIPKFGSPTPNRLLRIFGSDSQVFLKGRQCENHGLGIGAFSYYRRVVESHKDQLFDEIIRVAQKIAPDTVEALEQAKQQHQFLNALESVKDVFPQGLLINGQNPLTLLHSALSDGLHARTDAECLQFAHDVRVVLAELAERMGQALKDEAELAAAVARLTKKPS